MPPVPPGRGRWLVETQEGEVPILEARSRRLTRQLNSPAQFIFSLDGRSEYAPLLEELETWISVRRWRDNTGQDMPMFRGLITQSQDTVSEQRHTVNYVCHDALALANRRFFTRPRQTVGQTAPWLFRRFTQIDQDVIVQTLLNDITSQNQTTSGVSLAATSALPLTWTRYNPDGTTRNTNSGRFRDRDYRHQKSFGEALEQLANVIDGFEYDVGFPLPNVPQRPPFSAQLRIFYPEQGVQRSNFAFVYGSTVSALTRSFNSANFANYWRVIGETPNDQSPALYAEAWTQEAASGPGRLWPSGESLSDVTEVPTLADRAAANLAQSRLMLPSYSLQIMPGAWVWREFEMGDTVKLVVQSGRLNVDTWVRIVGMEFDITDEGEEHIEVTVTRPKPDLIRLLHEKDNRLSALELAR